MTRNTHSNKVINLSSVFPVNVSPLNMAWSRVFFATLGTSGWVSLLATNPLVKAPITHFVSLPSVIIRTRQFLQRFYSSRDFWSSLLIAICTSRSRELFVSFFRVTTSIAIIPRLYFGGRAVINFLTSRASSVRHNSYYSFNLGEMQYAVT